MGGQPAKLSPTPSVAHATELAEHSRADAHDAQHASQLQTRMVSSHTRLAQLQAHLTHLKSRLLSLRRGDAKVTEGLTEIGQAQARLHHAAAASDSHAVKEAHSQPAPTILVSRPAKVRPGSQSSME